LSYITNIRVVIIETKLYNSEAYRVGARLALALVVMLTPMGLALALVVYIQ
jgi:hypothetical protein